MTEIPNAAVAETNRARFQEALERVHARVNEHAEAAAHIDWDKLTTDEFVRSLVRVISITRIVLGTMPADEAFQFLFGQGQDDPEAPLDLTDDAVDVGTPPDMAAFRANLIDLLERLQARLDSDASTARSRTEEPATTA